MSIAVMSWVWKHSESKGADRLVLLAIADSANDAGREAYPSVSTIAEKANTDKRTAQRSIRHLVELGELRVMENGGPKGCHRYHVLMAEKGRGDATPASHRPGDTPPRQDATPASRPAGGGISSQKGRGDATRTVLDPSKTHPSSSDQKSDKPPTTDRDPRFVEFYDAYPRHEKRVDAFKAYRGAVGKASVAELLAGAIRYRDDPNREPEFTKLPGTWLRGGCWTDDPLPPRNGSRGSPPPGQRPQDVLAALSRPRSQP